MAETADLTIVGASDRTQWASEYWWSFNQSQVYFCFRHKIKNEKRDKPKNLNFVKMEQKKPQILTQSRKTYFKSKQWVYLADRKV